MPIVKVIYYQLRCDGCGKSQRKARASPGSAVVEATTRGYWLEWEGKWYCIGCQDKGKMPPRTAGPLPSQGMPDRTTGGE